MMNWLGIPLLFVLWRLMSGHEMPSIIPPLGVRPPPPRPPRPPAPRPRPTHRPHQARPPAATPTAVPVPVPVPVPAAVPVQYRPPAAPPAATTPAWPQAVPAGLPAFPGPGWTPDEPPGAGVVARANALLPQLWAHGAGTRKTEQTAGRWITYVATPMGSKHGVVAYRLTAPPQHTTTTSVPVPAASPSPSSPMAMPTLRRGSRGASVQVLQRRLGISDDGIFGAGTDAAVRAYQRSHGLSPDGVVGRMTWTSLFAANA